MAQGNTAAIEPFDEVLEKDQRDFLWEPVERVLKQVKSEWITELIMAGPHARTESWRGQPTSCRTDSLALPNCSRTPPRSTAAPTSESTGTSCCR